MRGGRSRDGEAGGKGIQAVTGKLGRDLAKLGKEFTGQKTKIMQSQARGVAKTS